jgi:hypothetical protein
MVRRSQRDMLPAIMNVTALTGISGHGFTYEWASPEQIPKCIYSRATDMFSLGLIFAFMMFKTSNFPRIQERVRASEAFGPCPGMLLSLSEIS